MNITSRQHATIECGVVIEKDLIIPIINVNHNGLYKRYTPIQIIGVDTL